MKAERLQEIRKDAETATAPELLGYVDELAAAVDDQLTTDLEAARDIAGRYFQVDADDESVHTHVLEQPSGWPADCGCRVICVSGDDTRVHTDPDCPQHGDGLGRDDRPSAYDMPVGSVVVGHDYSGNLRTLTCLVDYEHGDEWTDGVAPHKIRSGWVEGLFSDDLVTEWRLP